MKRTLTIVFTLLTCLSLAACSTNSSDHSKTDRSASSSKKSAKKAVSLAQYEAIKIGDHGSTEKSVKAKFGKSSVEAESEIPGAKKKATQYSWTNVG